MKNFIQNGDTVTITAPTGGVTSGQGVIVGNLFGIATKDATVNKSVEITTRGVFDLPKAPAIVFTAGQRVSWDDTNKLVVAPATGMYPIGIVLLAAGNGITTARVRLDGGSTAAT
jgi:predicted RecA/RadA family phage recombinase